MRALLIAVLLISSTSFAERVDICNTQYRDFNNYPTGHIVQGITCAFSTFPGERIVTRARWNYRPGVIATDVRLQNNMAIKHTPHFSEILYLNSPGNFYLRTGRIGELPALATIYTYKVPRGAIKGALEIETWSERSNLRALRPSINVMTGELQVPWQVNTNESFVPTRYVDIHLYGNRDGQSREANLGMWSLGPCVNQGLCSHTYVQSISQRVPIPRGVTQVTAIIDPDNNHAETNENSGDNRQSLDLNPFIFEEKIPGILANMGASFDLGRRLLNTWLDRGMRVKTDNPGVDWSLAWRITAEDTSWVLQIENASNLRFRNRFAQLISPGYFINEDTISQLSRLVRDKFSANPSANSVKLYNRYGGSFQVPEIRRYHEQHVQHVFGQSDYSEFAFDPITTALGRFAMYLVPFGEAVKYGNNQYEIRIKKLGIHIVDSFDFNGWQPLGCWREPASGSLLPFVGSYCTSNSRFSRYRLAKVRGGDFNLFMRPIEHDIEPNIKIRISR